MTHATDPTRKAESPAQPQPLDGKALDAVAGGNVEAWTAEDGSGPS